MKNEKCEWDNEQGLSICYEPWINSHESNNNIQQQNINTKKKSKQKPTKMASTKNCQRNGCHAHIYPFYAAPGQHCCCCCNYAVKLITHFFKFVSLKFFSFSCWWIRIVWDRQREREREREGVRERKRGAPYNPRPQRQAQSRVDRVEHGPSQRLFVVAAHRATCARWLASSCSSGMWPTRWPPTSAMALTGRSLAVGQVLGCACC